MPDRIHLTSLALHLPEGLGPSAFGLTPPPPCPVNVSLVVDLHDQVVPSCVNDDTMGGLGVNYSSLSKEIIKLAASRSWSTPVELVRVIGALPLALGAEVVERAEVEVDMPKASLCAESIAYSAIFAHGQLDGEGWKCALRNIRVRTILGLHPHERREKQWVETDIVVRGYGSEWDHRTAAESVYQWLEASSFGTIEALVDKLANHVLSLPSIASSSVAEVEVTVRKPSALAFALPSITILRSQSSRTITQTASSSSDGSSRIFVALGSNIGDRVRHITDAVQHLEGQGVRLVRTSRLYESEPMYEEDQDRFINGVIEVESDLAPLDLLTALKRTERAIGRTKTYRNGPRVVDLDLLIHGTEVVRIGREGDAENADGVGWLECPHPRIFEREFVLRPLADIAIDLPIPGTGRSVRDMFNTLASTSKSTLAPIIPFPRRPLRLDGVPKVMQIFNATPDSFSDGDPDLDIPSALSRIKELFSIPFPPDILDIGGMSTRPNSQPCSEEEELQRVVPLIQAIRASDDAVIRDVRISVDTYRANVARAAAQAGADCINDVRGGTEPGMLEVMAEMGAPVVLMHSRGDSTSMTTAALQDYSTLGGVVAGVQKELRDGIAKALTAGVKGWNIVVDPGLGFAKSHEDNLGLLREIGSLEFGYPVLVGGSRKGFVGKVIGRSGKEEAKERGYGDAAVVAWCAKEGSGVGVVRVHDGRGMGEVLRMWEGIRG